MGEAHREVTLRFYELSGWVEADAEPGDIQVVLDLLKFARVAAVDPGYITEVLSRSISGEEREVFASLTRILDAFYRARFGREPSLFEMTEDMSVVYPDLSRDEVIDRLRQVAEEEAA